MQWAIVVLLLVIRIVKALTDIPGAVICLAAGKERLVSQRVPDGIFLAHIGVLMTGVPQEYYHAHALAMMQCRLILIVWNGLLLLAANNCTSIKYVKKLIYKYNYYISILPRMLLPVKCFTCGMEISSYYRAYEREVRKKKLAAGVSDVIYLTKVHAEKTAEGEVLDNLQIRKMCCRRHLLTHVEIE